MVSEIQSIELKGRILLEMDIKAVTGLHIGGSPAALGIGDLDNPIIRDPITLRPYIPGSSLRGKLRSLWEKANNARQNQPIGRDVRIHGRAEKSDGQSDFAAFETDPVLPIFGVTGDNPVPNPTRLIVHDTFLSDDSVEALNRAETDQPFTETKWEAAIDRITSAAVPRQIERVPAQSVFSDCRLVFSLYGTQTVEPTREIEWFMDIFTMLALVEDDYLGGSGSRGSGRVAFENILLTLKKPLYNAYQSLSFGDGKRYTNLDALRADQTEIENALIEQFNQS